MAEGSGAAPVLVVEGAGAVTTITLNRPDRGNALTTELKTELLAALTQPATDPGVRAVVLTGAGGAFCAGQDLAEHAAALDADPVDGVRDDRAALRPDRHDPGDDAQAGAGGDQRTASGPGSAWPWRATCASPPPAPAWRRRSRRSG